MAFILRIRIKKPGAPTRKSLKIKKKMIWAKLSKLLAESSWQVTAVVIIAVFIGITGAFKSSFRESILHYYKAPALQIVNRILVVIAVILSIFADIPESNGALYKFIDTITLFLAVWFGVFIVFRLVVATFQWVFESL